MDRDIQEVLHRAMTMTMTIAARGKKRRRRSRGEDGAQVGRGERVLAEICLVLSLCAGEDQIHRVGIARGRREEAPEALRLKVK